MQSRSFALVLSSTIAVAAFAPGAAVAQAPSPRPSPSAQPLPAVLPPVPNVAPGYAAPTGVPLPSGDLVGVDAQPFVGIALGDAIAMALQKNTELAIAQSNQRIANYQIVAARGAYDVRFQLQPQYQHGVSPAISSFQSGPRGGPITQDTAGVTTSFSGVTKGGQQYRIGGTATRITSNASVNSYDPFYEAALSFNFTQPLGRGSATDEARRALALADAGSHVQTSVLLAQASQTVANVSATYWDLVAAWRNVGIQEEGLRQAQAQAQSNARLAQRGAVAPVDIVESNTQVNVFADNVFAALQNVQRLQTQLKVAIVANPADPVWSANLVPTSAVLQLPSEPKLDDLIVVALRNRPEIAQLRAQRLIAAANLAFARDQLKPQIDLGLGFTTNGFAGIPTDPSANPISSVLGAQLAAINTLIARANAGQPPANQIPLLSSNVPQAPPYQNGRFGQSFANALNFRYPTYAVQLTIQLPLRNRTAKANYGIAEEQSRQIAVGELALLQRIRAEAVNAIQTLRATQYRLVAAANARAAAERVLVAEQRRFTVGSSTTFLILQRQLDLANQRGRELQAQTDLNKAVVEVNRVGGTVFSANNIDVSALGAPTLAGATPGGSNLPPAPK